MYLLNMNFMHVIVHVLSIIEYRIPYYVVVIPKYKIFKGTVYVKFITGSKIGPNLCVCDNRI